jgi:hypothetical protein
MVALSDEQDRLIIKETDADKIRQLQVAGNFLALAAPFDVKAAIVLVQPRVLGHID